MLGIVIFSLLVGVEGFKFDVDNDDISPFVLEMTRGSILGYLDNTGSNAPIILHTSLYIDFAWFDAAAPYHKTATGIIAEVPRRPENESKTKRNVNIAVLHATYHVLKSLVPKSNSFAMKVLVGALGQEALTKLDSNDMSTPEGIGKYVGELVAKAAHTNGLNSLGDMGGKRYNLKPFEDYTNYSSVNSANVVVDPTRWQPQLLAPVPGVLTSQQFVTPQMGVVKPIAEHNINNFNLPNHGRSIDGSPEYIRSTNEVTDYLANITDNQKAASQLFDNKYHQVGPPLLHILKKKNMAGMLEIIYLATIIHLAQHDALIKVWQEKRSFDAVRPFTAIRRVHGQSLINGYVRDKGLVKNIRPDEWDSYLYVPDHPEYPSASAAICGALGEVMREKFGSDEAYGFVHQIAKGSSKYETDSPKKDEIVGPYDTWTDFENSCAMSRVHAGLNFIDSVEEGKKIGRQYAKGAIDFLNRHLNPEE